MNERAVADAARKAAKAKRTADATAFNETMDKKHYGGSVDVRSPEFHARCHYAAHLERSIDAFERRRERLLASQVPVELTDEQKRSPERDAQHADTEKYLNQFKMGDGVTAALNKKVDGNRQKILADMQTTQTHEPIDPQYVFNAERQKIKNEKEKSAPQPNAEPPSNNNWFARLWRRFTSSELSQSRLPPMSVHDMMTFGKDKTNV